MSQMSVFISDSSDDSDNCEDDVAVAGAAVNEEDSDVDTWRH